MRRNGKISPYVKALWELGIEETDLEDIREILRENPKLKKCWKTREFPDRTKAGWLTECFRRLIKGCCKLW
ncbi:hypothetical protein [Suipraeoptans intestinalis]|uniref:hypothetical protein n=1 Tax=Suipraeoptans intestinalis TaxID=2606628 RepID=UPI0015647A86|nr:hypothetical protein [Suipraeoptans intestinalis]